MGTAIVKKIGPSWAATVNKDLDDEEAALRGIRQNEIDSCLGAISAENKAQADASAWADIIAAEKEAVGLQLEAEYRSRLAAAHLQVKASITPDQEKAALKKCISDLKALSAAA